MLLFVLALLPDFTLASSIKGSDLDIPFDNKTALNDEVVTSWVSSAEQRGTGDILYSCLITITLCVFTFLHLNIPVHSERA
jgi:hypothetical protein